MRHRVFTYITKNEELLVFDHVDHQHLEPQIPGGTVEPGEDPEKAALREAREETGLEQLTVKRLLSSFKRDLSSMGRDEVIHAWFYHLETNEQTKSRWRHFELDPSEGNGPIEFEFYWVPLDQIPKLGGIDNEMIAELQKSILQTSR